MVVTAHFITEKWQLRELAIAFYPMVVAHTAENLADQLLTVFQDLAITEKVVAVVSDNASNAHASLKTL